MRGPEFITYDGEKYWVCKQLKLNKKLPFYISGAQNLYVHHELVKSLEKHPNVIAQVRTSEDPNPDTYEWYIIQTKDNPLDTKRLFMDVCVELEIAKLVCITLAISRLRKLQLLL